MRRVILIGDSRMQRDVYICNARDLFSVSPWFFAAREYAIAFGWRYYILMPDQYGIAHPRALIKPYSNTMTDFSKEQRREWADVVLRELGYMFKPETHSFTIIAGQLYRQFLVPGLRQRGFAVDTPTRGMRIEDQTTWLSAQVAEKRKQLALAKERGRVEEQIG